MTFFHVPPTGSISLGPRGMHRIGEKSERGVALRVHVDEQDSSLLACEKGRQVDGCDRLATPTFLVHDRYRAHTHSSRRLCSFFHGTVAKVPANRSQFVGGV